MSKSKSIEEVLLSATGANTPTPLLWDFRCHAEQVEGNKYRVRIVGNLSGEVRESIGYHPLWELIRLIGVTP